MGNIIEPDILAEIINYWFIFDIDMDKIFHFIIEAWYWFLIFLSPVFGTGIIGLILLYGFSFEITFLYILIIIGAIIGIFFAEHVRREYGCSNFWSRTMATPDIDPIDEEKKEDENRS